MIRSERPNVIVCQPIRPSPPPAPPANPSDDLTDKDSLDKAYSTDADLSTIKNTLYISRTNINKVNDIYDDITKVPKIWNAVQQLSTVNRSCLA